MRMKEAPFLLQEISVGVRVLRIILLQECEEIRTETVLLESS